MEWISVKDRLPISRKCVLAYQPETLCTFTMYYADGEWNYFCRASNATERYYKITHWMPLPEPPNMEEERLKQEMYEREASGYISKDGE